MRLVSLTMAMVVTAILMCASANCFAFDLYPLDDLLSISEPSGDLLTPARHQVDIEAQDAYMFTVGANTLRRRINSFPDSAISLKHDMGVSQLQLPEVLLSYWIDSVNALQFQFRYYGIYGSKPQTQPLAFGGTIIGPPSPTSPIQNLNPGGTRWYTFGGYYERRLTPIYQDREDGLPQFLQGWDTRAKIGLEFTYNDFRINDGKPNFSQVSPFEARIRFHDKGLPIPVIGLEERRWLGHGFAFEVTAQGYWANKWDSGRSEGGTVYDSQSGFETHWRIIYTNTSREWRGLAPFAGLNYNYTKYTQTSDGVGNLLRTQLFGPEVGFNWSI
jgi:hypothetical protein